MVHSPKTIFKSIILTVFVLFLSAGHLYAADILARGSDSTRDVASALAQAFKTKTGISITIEGGGSSKGARDCLTGNVNLAFMSRAPKQKEIDAGLVGLPYCIDGVAIIVNPQNGLDTISIDELKAIYTGSTKKWADGKPIFAFNRPADSGTREVFQKKVLGKGNDFAPNIKIKHHQATLTTVSKAPTALAYASVGGLSEKANVKIIKVNNTFPTADTLRDGSYALSRTPHFATKGPPAGDVEKFLNFVVSAEGKKVIEASGYVTLN